mmetsp:Transcript_19806/g.50313  ORF Transcript_19806/g.50313 Transcript_19806/m.50313 type:complete len:343 (-) Transcript_19806:635-1663(-)
MLTAPPSDRSIMSASSAGLRSSLSNSSSMAVVSSLSHFLYAASKWLAAGCTTSGLGCTGPAGIGGAGTCLRSLRLAWSAWLQLRRIRATSSGGPVSASSSGSSSMSSHCRWGRLLPTSLGRGTTGGARRRLTAWMDLGPFSPSSTTPQRPFSGPERILPRQPFRNLPFSLRKLWTKTSAPTCRAPGSPAAGGRLTSLRASAADAEKSPAVEAPGTPAAPASPALSLLGAGAPAPSTEDASHASVSGSSFLLVGSLGSSELFSTRACSPAAHRSSLSPVASLATTCSWLPPLSPASSASPLLPAASLSLTRFSNNSSASMGSAGNSGCSLAFRVATSIFTVVG